MTSPSPAASLRKMLDDLRAFVEYERDEGKRFLEVSSVRRLAAGHGTVQTAKAVMPTARSSPAARKPRPEPGSAAAIPPPAPGARAPEPVRDKDAEKRLLEIAESVKVCTKCHLHKTRTRAVPGQGCPTPDILFVGEAPGEDEDRLGLAFVGRAGQLLTKMIDAMGYTREEVFIANILKCRPPENRTPLPDEIATCMPYLTEQIRLLKPKVIIALGATAVKGLLNLETGITRLRGKWLSYEGVRLMPTYHPSYLLRRPEAKKEAWIDLQEVLRFLGRTPPPRPPAAK